MLYWSIFRMTDHTPVHKKGKSRALRASQVHSDRKCTQCTLCNENANFYVHSVTWKPSEVSLLHRLAPDVSETNRICRAYGEDIKWGVHLSEYTPRWVKLQHKTVSKVCAILDCITNTKSVKVTRQAIKPGTETVKQKRNETKRNERNRKPHPK